MIENWRSGVPGKIIITFACLIILSMLGMLMYKLFSTLPFWFALFLSAAHLVIAGSFGLLVGLLFRRLTSRKDPSQSEPAHPS